MSRNKKIVLISISIMLLILALIYFNRGKKKDINSQNNNSSNSSSTNNSKDKINNDTSNVDLYDKDPLLSFLPIQTDEYIIDFENGNSKNIINITLTPILNYDWQKDEYNKNLRIFKKNALDKIKSYNNDLSKYTINVYPPKDLNNLSY